MTYAALVAALETLALEAGAASFWTGVKAAAGINYNQPFPMAELFILPSALLGETTVQYSIGMGFYAKDLIEGGGPDAVALQSQMDELTQRFVRLVREHEDMELQERDGQPVVQRLPTVRTGTKVGTGLFIDFTINVAALPC